MKKYAVELLAVGNVGSWAAFSWVRLEPMLNALLNVSQVAVAAVTVVYIVRKIRALKVVSKTREPEDDEKLNYEV